MNISKKLKGLVAACVAAVGMTAVAEPTVTVDKVKTGEPWSKITVNYTLGGTDAKTDYKVAFDVTAKDQTASVTNDAAKLTDGAATKEIDTATLFGKEVVDTKAKVKVSLIAIKPKLGGVQLWANGPFWAECNVGGTIPGDYGEHYWFYNDTAKTAAESLGDVWRLPTVQEFKDLIANCDPSWETCKDSTGADINGYRFTGKGDYSSNSIFLPAAGRYTVGVDGGYWSSEPAQSGDAYGLLIKEKSSPSTYPFYGGEKLSVRAVRDAE